MPARPWYLLVERGVNVSLDVWSRMGQSVSEKLTLCLVVHEVIDLGGGSVVCTYSETLVCKYVEVGKPL